MEERTIDEQNRLTVLGDKLLWGEISPEAVSTEDLRKIREMIAEDSRRTRLFSYILKREAGLREEG